MHTISRLFRFSPAMFVFLLLQCTPENPEPTFDVIEPQDSHVRQGQLVLLANKALTLEDDQYPGVFGSVAITLTKSNDTTLVFMVPLGAQTGETVLKIKDLEVAVTYEVDAVELTGTPESLITTVNETFEAALASLPAETSPAAHQAYGVFTQLMQNATQHEKQEFAVFYESNKEMFTALLGDNSPEGRSNTLEDCDTFKKSFIDLLVGVTATVALTYAPDPTFATKAAAAAFAIGTAYKYDKAILASISCMLTKIKVDLVKLMGVDSEGRVNSVLLFNEGAETPLTIQLGMRGLKSSDSNSTSPVIASVFSTVEKFNSQIVSKVNGLISWVNDKVPFSNIPLLKNFAVPTSAETVTADISQALSENLTFSLTDERIKITSKVFKDGKVALTLATNKVVNPATPISTNLSFEYKDANNQYTGQAEISFAPSPLELTFVTTDRSILQGQPKSLVAKVTRGGQPLANATVAFSVQSGNGSVSPGSVITTADGTATVTVNQTGETAPAIKAVLQDYQAAPIAEKTFTYTNNSAISWIGVWDVVYLADDDNENGVIDAEEEENANQWYSRTEDCHGTLDTYERKFSDWLTFSGTDVSGDLIWSEKSEHRGWDEGNECGGENGIFTDEHQETWSYNAATNTVTFVFEDGDDPGVFYPYDYTITLEGSVVVLTTMDDGELTVYKIQKRQ